MVKYREILRLIAMGVSQESVAFSCGCAQSTVSDVIRAARARGLSWPLPEEMDDAAIRSVIYPKRSRKATDKAAIDFEHVARELGRRGMTLSLLWNEYCDSAVSRGEEPYMYSAFCREYRKWAQAHDVRMRIDHRPAETIQVDWVGDTAEVVDPDTGELLRVYVFAGCLPYSNYLFAEGFYRTDEQAWIDAHAHMFSFFGGATPVLVPDNCKTAVSKNTKEALIVNEQYRRMSEHYGCAVVPARVRRPRDKASVEMGVGLIERQAMLALRGRRFMSLGEFNSALADQVAAINSRPFQKREGSRESVFLAQEKPLLIPLPATPYEMTARKEVTVNFNYHVCFDGCWYSVPFEFVKRTVAVVATAMDRVGDGGRHADRHARARSPQGRVPHQPRPHAGCPQGLRRMERRAVQVVGREHRGGHRAGDRGHPVVAQDRAAVVPLVPRRARPGEDLWRGAFGGSVPKGPSQDAEAQLQDYKGRNSGTCPGSRAHRRGGRRLSEGPGLLPKDRERRRRQRRERRTMMASQSTMDKLHDMRLSVMARAYRDQEELPAASGLSFDERLAMIVDAEWDSRRTNKRLRHLRQAGFPEQDANIADVRYDDDRKLDRAQMAELSNCSWIASRRNIIVTGASGAGKTWISNALGVAACNAFYTVRYTRLPELLDELTVFKDEEWLKQRKKYIKCDLLIIDDWLLEQVKPNEAREIMEVIEARDMTGSLILCSQFPPSAWHANLGNGAIADAVIDRVVYKSYTIHIAGEESMRKRMRGME